MSLPFGQDAGQALALIHTASNVPGQETPTYTTADFLAFYPQFDQNVPGYILDQFVTMANAAVPLSRWHEMRPMGLANFVAHFATLYMDATGDVLNPTATQVINNAKTKGIISSKSVGDVSVSYDTSQAVTGLEGWAQWKATSYGAQYATLARMLGKAGMYVW